MLKSQVLKTCGQHEESESAEKSLSDTTTPKKNTALMLVSCSLASARQQKSLLIFHCGECLLLIQIPCAKSRHHPPPAHL